MLAPYNESLRKDLGLSRTFVTGCFAVALLVAAGWINVTGRLADRYGARPIIMWGGLVQGCAMVRLGTAQSPVSIALGYCLLRASSVETVDFACRHCVNQWFEPRGNNHGSLRASAYAYNTEEEAKCFVDTFSEIIEGLSGDS